MARTFSLVPENGVTEQWFIRAVKYSPKNVFNKWGSVGVRALIEATPRDTGETAAAWRYEVANVKNTWSLSFINDNVVDRVPIAIILQYGHLTKSGTFVTGTDYINPAIQPVFDGLQLDLERELSML